MNEIMVGDRFGSLVVVEINGLWCKCACDCGEEKSFRKSLLSQGKKKSCGKFFRRNKTEDDELVSRVYLKEGAFFIVDKEKIDLVKKYKWRTNEEGYVVSTSGGSKIFLHRLIMGLGPYKKGGITVDHIDRNKLNNLESNLRLATKTENKRNGNIRKDNTSGVIGVHIYKPYNKYHAFISVDGIDKHLGYFDVLEGAIIARLRAEFQYFGEFAPQRHLFMEYGVI